MYCVFLFCIHICTPQGIKVHCPLGLIKTIKIVMSINNEFFHLPHISAHLYSFISWHKWYLICFCHPNVWWHYNFPNKLPHIMHEPLRKPLETITHLSLGIYNTYIFLQRNIPHHQNKRNVFIHLLCNNMQDVQKSAKSYTLWYFQPQIYVKMI